MPFRYAFQVRIASSFLISPGQLAHISLYLPVYHERAFLTHAWRHYPPQAAYSVPSASLLNFWPIEKFHTSSSSQYLSLRRKVAPKRLPPPLMVRCPLVRPVHSPLRVPPAHLPSRQLWNSQLPTRSHYGSVRKRACRNCKGPETSPSCVQDTARQQCHRSLSGLQPEPNRQRTILKNPYLPWMRLPRWFLLLSHDSSHILPSQLSCSSAFLGLSSISSLCGCQKRERLN